MPIKITVEDVDEDGLASYITDHPVPDGRPDSSKYVVHEPEPLNFIACVEPVLREPEDGDGEYLQPPNDLVPTEKLYVPEGSKNEMEAEEEYFVAPSYVTPHTVFSMPDSKNTAEQSEDTE